MSRILRAALFGVVGAIVLGVVTFMGGFGLAKILGPEAAQGLGMMVPMVFTPLAMLVGLVGGAWRGWTA
jgi:hypothetical protein